MKVIKRNGKEAEFNKEKIILAITKANKEMTAENSISKDTIYKIADTICAEYKKRHATLSVEDVQDLVETHLMQEGAYELAKSYIRYRYWRNQVRQHNTTDDRILSLIQNSNEDVKQENSNKNPTIASVQRDYMAGEVSKDLTRRYFLPAG